MHSVAVHMTDSSKAAELRRFVLKQTRAMSWDENDSARAALLSTELATNLLKHAQTGVAVMNAFQTPAGGSRLQLVGIDRGPGVADLERCFEDGYSTAGSP